MNLKKTLPTIVLATALPLVTATASAGKEIAPDETNLQQATQDAWLKGKVETAMLLNGHLNNFKIETEVEGGTVELSGEVDSDIKHDLAEEIALGVDGVKDVTNNIKVKTDIAANETDTKSRSLKAKFDDLTLGTTVKTKLVANTNIAARDINVDTMNGVVTLKGEVDSKIERDLAVKIAENVEDVKKVEDELTIASS